MSKRNMSQSWPFPGYKWHGPGTYDYLVEDVIADHNGDPILPDFPKDLQCCQETFIWYSYDVPYPVLLVDQVNQMLLTTPVSASEQPLVPLELYERAWNELKLTLKEYLQFHFTECPQSHSFDAIEEKCANIIGTVANQYQWKPQNWDTIRDEIQKAANLVSQLHIENSNTLLQDAGLYTKEHMESVTMQGLAPSTSVCSESKTTTDEEEGKRRRSEKEKGNQRRAE